MLGISVIGSAVWIGLFLCVRRFDVDQGTDGDGKGGGGGSRGPRPDHPAGPVEIVDPPLGEIRASRHRPLAEPPRERRERATALRRGSGPRA
jgi:hypothetical protein